MKNTALETFCNWWSLSVPEGGVLVRVLAQKSPFLAQLRVLGDWSSYHPWPQLITVPVVLLSQVVMG